MRILLSAALFCALSLAVGACLPESHDFTIRVTGSKGVKFSGSYMVIGDGKSVSKSVENTVPTEYRVKGQIVSVSFQKQIALGKLGVEILRGGQSVANAETTAEYGVASASSN